MVFSSYLFIFYFLPLSLVLYYLAPQRGRHLLLTVLSYIFYGWVNPWFVVLMFASSTVDYIAGLVVSGDLGRSWKEPPPYLIKGGPRTRFQKGAMIASVASNLALLGFFKYFNFGVENYNSLVAALGLSHLGVEDMIRITLPLGISFYTFQSMSYAIDVYRGEARPIRNFIDFLCFVAMYPQLVAGPIVRFQEVSEQLRERSHTAEKFARGVAFFACGLAKKTLLANPCGKIADLCFDAGSIGWLDSWLGLISYSFQIYFDFSGYSDMAVGLGLMLGFVFCKNFDSPYKSMSITEFWRRWHLSLSILLRDYLYIPLGGNRKGEARTYANLATVMLLGGLWHGASWNFVIWGGIHGGMLALERLQGKTSLYHRLPGFVRVALTFGIVSLAWVFFRATDLHASLGYIKSLFGGGAVDANARLLDGLIYQPYYVISLVLAGVIVWCAPQAWDFTRRLSWARATWCLAIMMVAIATTVTQAYNPFIYFIF